MKNADLITAIIECEPNCRCKIVGEQVYSNVTWLNEHVPSEADVDEKLAELVSAWEANEYSRNRAEAYDSVGNQLDMLMKDMKNGTTTHQEACEAVKDRFPKP